MSKRIELSYDEEMRVKSLYEQGVKVDKICEDTGLSVGSMYLVLDRYNVDRRVPNKYHKVKRVFKEKSTCRECGAILPRKARFCPMCGAKAYIDSHVALDSLNMIINLIRILELDSKDKDKFLQYCDDIYTYLLSRYYKDDEITKEVN